MVEERNAYRSLWEARRKETTKNTQTQGQLVLRWMLERQDEMLGTS
jgi:hypothetical protein